jgi:glycosyltransferase involved in cell wall biosynthesis
MTPVISVVIPTHNPRMDYLRRVLEALRGQTLAKDLWELLIVDNGSHAPLKAVAGPKDQKAQEPPSTDIDMSWHPNARVVREERLGLTFARLRAIAEAKGELLVWVDDDNVVCADYLTQAVQAFDSHPQLAAAGGKSLPEYETEPPEWFEPDLVPLGVRDLGDKELFVQWAPNQPGYYPAFAPIGAGMVTRRKPLAAWASAIQSDPRRLKFGRTGNALTSGEDNDMNLAMLAAGWEVAYLPQLSLTHLIAKRRLSFSYCAKLVRVSFRDFIAVLDAHGIRPWPAMPKWTLPLRVASDWWRVKPWRGPKEALRWWSNIGMYEGRAALPAMPAAAAVGSGQ